MQKMLPIVTFTPLAKEKLSEALKEQDQSGSYLRIDVYASGGCACSGGYSYGMQLAEKPRGGDVVEEVGGFKIENPNVQGQGCGCGTGAGHGGEPHGHQH